MVRVRCSILQQRHRFALRLTQGFDGTITMLPHLSSVLRPPLPTRLPAPNRLMTLLPAPMIENLPFAVDR